jgi:hypothetical protein
MGSSEHRAESGAGSGELGSNEQGEQERTKGRAAASRARGRVGGDERGSEPDGVSSDTGGKCIREREGKRWRDCSLSGCGQKSFALVTGLLSSHKGIMSARASVLRIELRAAWVDTGKTAHFRSVAWA